jgi:hypothetical protein
VIGTVIGGVGGSTVLVSALRLIQIPIEVYQVSRPFIVLPATPSS